MFFHKELNYHFITFQMKVCLWSFCHSLSSHHNSREPDRLNRFNQCRHILKNPPVIISAHILVLFFLYREIVWMNFVLLLELSIWFRMLLLSPYLWINQGATIELFLYLTSAQCFYCLWSDSCMAYEQPHCYKLYFMIDAITEFRVCGKIRKWGNIWIGCMDEHLTRMLVIRNRQLWAIQVFRFADKCYPPDVWWVQGSLQYFQSNAFCASIISKRNCLPELML